MSTQYKTLPDLAAARDAAEALARLWAVSIGKLYTPTGVGPDSHGPGRRPDPPELYFQRYWQAPLDAQIADVNLGTKDLPIRIETDPFTIAQDGKVVPIAGGKQITLDFKNLAESSAQASPDAKVASQSAKTK